MPINIWPSWSPKRWSNKATLPKSPMRKTTRLLRSKSKRKSALSNSSSRNNNNKNCSISKVFVSESNNSSWCRGSKRCSSSKLRSRDTRRASPSNSKIITRRKSRSRWSWTRSGWAVSKRRSWIWTTLIIWFQLSETKICTSLRPWNSTYNPELPPIAWEKNWSSSTWACRICSLDRGQNCSKRYSRCWALKKGTNCKMK